MHLVTYLREDGYTPLTAALATGALGAMQVAGRIILTTTARRIRLADITAAIITGQVIAVAALLLIPGPAGLTLFVILFGLGFGAVHIARPDLLAGYVPRPLYVRVSGIQALLLVTAEALAPTAAAISRATTGSYTVMLIAVAACALGAALLFRSADRSQRRATTTP